MDSQSIPAAVIGVIKQFTKSPNVDRWVFEQLGEGSQAIIYAVRSQDRQPIWQTCRSLVLKLYKPGAANAAVDLELVRAEFEALSRSHAALNGRIINGWTISIPSPLYVCEWPIALVMTMVPGTKLKLCLETGAKMTPEVLESISRAVVAAMERCWSIGQLHGDLNFDNILCDIVKTGWGVAHAP